MRRRQMKGFLQLAAIHLGAYLAWAAPTGNGITIRNLTSSAQNNRPFTISRVFVQGEIPNYPRARVGGTAVLTQADVRSRWPDGSVKHAMVSFTASIPANGTISVDFIDQPSGNNTGYLDKQGMLSYGTGAWDAVIQTSLGSVSARTMLQNLSLSTDINSNQARYWLKGPIVTQVIVEDRSSTLAYDFGSDAYKSLHPVFVLTFYPGSGLGVKVEYVVENVWNTKVQDQSYSLTLTANGSTVFTKATFNHHARSRWRKVFWAGTAPTGWQSEDNPGVSIDYNLAYMVSSRALPNFDLTKSVSAAAVSSEVNDYNSKKGPDEPQWCVSVPNKCGSWTKLMPDPGGRGDLGVIPRWYVRYLYTFDPQLYPVMLGNALASGNAPVHLRETDPNLFYDSGRTVKAIGRPLSIDARPTGGYFPVGTTSGNGWNVDHAHQGSFVYVPYLITGDWYFLEELYFWSARNLDAINSCVDQHYCRHESWGYISHTVEPRGVAWALRTLGHTVFIAPDGTPEKQYFNEKLNNNIEIWEGFHGITNGAFPPSDPNCSNYNVYTSTSKWCWGNKIIRTRVIAAGKPFNNPLGFPEMGEHTGPAPSITAMIDTTKTGTNPVGITWMHHLLQIAWGLLKEQGFPVRAVQEVFAKFNINLVLNPASNPYFVGDFAYPIIRASDGQFFSTWSEWRSGFLAGYDPQPLFLSRAGDVEFGYSHIAYAALSYAPGVTAPGNLTGDAAWNWIKANLPNQSLQNDNPKWAIVPRTTSASPPPASGPSCDINTDGATNILDVQLAINASMGISSCGIADLDQDGACTVVDVQRVINAALGSSCRIGP